MFARRPAPSQTPAPRADKPAPRPAGRAYVNPNYMKWVLRPPSVVQRKCDGCGGVPDEEERPVQRKCAACAAKAAPVPVSAPEGADEREADRVADAVVRGSSAGSIESRPMASPTAARSAEGGAASSHGAAPPEAAARSSSGPSTWVPSGGSRIADHVRAPMEERFGRSFEHVRVHRSGEAAGMASALDATAYTLGSNVVLGGGAPSFDTDAGRRLLAHELTHTVQQEGGGAAPIQRKLEVVGTQPTNSDLPELTGRNDPAAKLTQAQRFSEMGSQVGALCGGFRVNSSSGVVEPTTNPAPSRAVRAAGTKKVGCCCLDVLTTSSTPWRIFVSQVVSPVTNFANNTVVLPPSGTPLDLGSFTAAGNYAVQGPKGLVPSMGHELCGHAALQDIGAHPAGDRPTTDVHDPTVNIENEVSKEQGVAAADLRGLAKDGAHRGESADRLVVRGYGPNDIAIPVAQQKNVDFALEYILANKPFVSIIGHSDPAGSAAVKQTTSKARAEAIANLLSGAIKKTGTAINLTFDGVADREPPNGNSAAPAAEWRRVEIFMASQQAGSQTPPAAATPGARTESPTLQAAKTSADPCVKLLATKAVP